MQDSASQLLRTLLPRRWVDNRIGPVQTIKNHRRQRIAPATALQSLSAERRQESCTVEALQHRTGAKRHPPGPIGYTLYIGFYRRRYWLAYS
jgi:hypothetical protein